MIASVLGGAVAAACLQGSLGFGIEAFNTFESEVSVAFSVGLDEVWLERRTGVWGEPGGSSRLLHARHRPDGRGWSAPELVPFTDARASEGDPFFEDVTQTLYFASNRAHPTLPVGDSNIWRVSRVDGVWDVPEPLPAPINGAGEEYSPIIRNGRLYFASSRNGSGDLFVATQQDGAWIVEQLGPALNSRGGEWNLWVDPADQLMLFEASERPTNVSVSGDVYASIRDASGDWLPALAIPELNGPGSDLNPRIVCGRVLWASTSPHPEHADLYTASVDVPARIREAYGQRLHVANRSSHELASVELASGRIVDRTPIGPGPHLVSAGPDALAVAAYGAFPRPHSEPVIGMPGWVEEPGGELLVIHAPGVEDRLQRLALPCVRPHGSAWDDVGSRVWITCEDRQGVVEVTLGSTSQKQRLLTTGYEGAHVLAWDRPRNQLLVAHTEAGGVSFLRLDSGEAAFLGLAPGAEALWIDESRRQAWVTLGASGELAVVDLAERIEIARVEPGCVFPIDFAAAGDALWVACFGSGELVAIDLITHEVSDRIKLPAGPLNVEAHPSLPVLYASLPRQNRVVEVSVIGGGVTRSFETGIEPDGLVLLSQPGG